MSLCHCKGNFSQTPHPVHVAPIWAIVDYVRINIRMIIFSATAWWYSKANEGYRKKGQKSQNMVVRIFHLAVLNLKKICRIHILDYILDEIEKKYLNTWSIAQNLSKSWKIFRFRSKYMLFSHSKVIRSAPGSNSQNTYLNSGKEVSLQVHSGQSY